MELILLIQGQQSNNGLSYASKNFRVDRSSTDEHSTFVLFALNALVSEMKVW